MLLIATMCIIVAINIEKRINTPIEWIVTQYASVSEAQGMFYTIEDVNRNLVIIDGGWTVDAEQVRQVIAEHGNHVTAWIITHPHPDHVGAFNVIANDIEDIVIDHIYTVDVNYERYEETALDYDGFDACREFFKQKEKFNNIHYVHENDELELVGLHLKILSAWDEEVDKREINLCNVGSMCFRVDGESESVLFCADLGGSVEASVIEKHKDELAADYVQAGHHGNWGLSTEFYAHVSPKYVFFDSTDALLEQGELGYDAGELKDYFEAKGVEVHNYSSAPNEIVLH